MIDRLLPRWLAASLVVFVVIWVVALILSDPEERLVVLWIGAGLIAQMGTARAAWRSFRRWRDQRGWFENGRRRLIAADRAQLHGLLAVMATLVTVVGVLSWLALSHNEWRWLIRQTSLIGLFLIPVLILLTSVLTEVIWENLMAYPEEER